MAIAGLRMARAAKFALRPPVRQLQCSSRWPAIPSRNSNPQCRLLSLSSAKPNAIAAANVTNNPSTTTPDEYHPPTTGILSRIPASWVPYGELIRIDKPAGTIYLFLPCLWSTILAATISTPTASIPSILGTVALFGTGAVIMRGAGCTVNDFWDRKIDPLVERTKYRPIARGAISPTQTIAFLGAQLFAGAGVLFSLPLECIYWGIPSLALVATYPLFKRITHYPQVALGLAYSWGALLGFPAMGLSLSDPAVLATAGCLYASNVAWTVLYDTIYAHQDLSDDVKAGVMSIAVKHEHDTKKIMSGLAVVQVGFLGAAGVLAGCGPVFFVGSCGGAAMGLGWMIYRARLKVVSDCWYWFRWCAIAVGGVAVGGGLFGEYLARRYNLYGNTGLKENQIES
ncbi:UbiA prenyltransferase family-domain-containing protein [Peziza echinospora]|nr:UbiA prenyltransferase family-domain-containing protein [Peziza echinospora]